MGRILEERAEDVRVAPVPMAGTTMTPGHIVLVIASIACTTSGLSGDGALAFASSTKETAMLGSARTSTSFCLIAAGASSGRMRQLTFAAAVCGNALFACPPSRRVATQVVRMRAL